MYQEVRSEKKLNMKKFFEVKSVIAYLLSIVVGATKLASGATPFGLALLGAFADVGFPLVIPLCLIGITTWIAFGSICFLKFIIAAIIFILMKSFIKGNTKTGNAAKILFATAISETLMLLATETLIYDAVMAAFMSTTTAIFYLIFSEGLPIVLDYQEHKINSHETLMAAGILFTVVASAVGNFSVIGLSVRNILCILIVLLIGWRRGTACGVITGLSVSIVLGMMGYAEASTVATYTVCGMLAGVLSRYGKIGAIIGFVLGNAVWAFYSNASTEIIIPIGEIIVASVLLFFLPKRVTHFMDDLIHFETTLESKDPIGLLAESTIYKLKSVSEVAEDMANNVEKELPVMNDEMTCFVKNLKENTCLKCKNYHQCWNQNYHAIYETSFNALETLKKKNELTEEEVKNAVCEFPSLLKEGLENAYELYKLDDDWKSRMKENNQLAAKQLRGVSQAIHHIQEEMLPQEEKTATKGVGYKVEFATCGTKKSGNTISGDTVHYLTLKNGKKMVGISDGMGTGEVASKSSQKVLSLLEKYMNTGLEKQVAVDMLNSYMMLGEHQENYATLDALFIDEDSSKVEMIKFGACPTYMIKNRTVTLISSQSLPVGAIADTKVMTLEQKIERGVIFVMISDGILESNAKKEKWVKELLEALITDNVQRIADITLQEAIDNNLGVAKDDMSVAVVKIC